MDVRGYRGRAGAASSVAALLVCTSMAAATAASTATAPSPSQAVKTGTWAAVAGQAVDGSSGTGALSLTFRNAGNTSNPSFEPQYFNVSNTGSLAISKAAYTGTATAPSSVNFVVESCSGTWNETSGACQGSPGTIATVLTTPTGSSSTTVVSTTVPEHPGAALRLKATLKFSGNVPSSPATTLTIGVAVDRTYVRAARTIGG